MGAFRGVVGCSGVVNHFEHRVAERFAAAQSGIVVHRAKGAFHQ